MKKPHITRPFEYPTDEDCEAIVIAARLRGVSAITAAQGFMLGLPQNHPLLHNQIERMVFQSRLAQAEKKYEAALKQLL